MDTLTHALSGALLACATARGERTPETVTLRRRVIVGAAAAAFPDIDVVASYLSPLSYLYHHRGVTHSLPLVPLWAMLIALAFAALWRGKHGWRAYFGVAAGGVLIHIVGDLITSFGTMIFAPFSDTRYALSATFIIDLWFTGIIVAALIASRVWPQSRLPAVAGLSLLVAYVGSQLWLQQRAIDFGEEYAARSGSASAQVTALPRPVSPFNWTVIVADDARYRFAHINLIRDTVREPGPNAGFISRLDSAYRPLRDARWLEAPRFGNAEAERAFASEAYAQPQFRFFRWFAAYPVVLRTDLPEGCAWFHDLRFVTPGRDNAPFRYGMCRGGDGEWRAFQLVGESKLPVY